MSLSVKGCVFLSLMYLLSQAKGSKGECRCVPASHCADGGGAISPRQNLTRSDCPGGFRNCCVIVIPTTTTTTTTPPPLPPCGIQKTTNVPGFGPLPSDAANFGEFPWLVRILDKNEKFLGTGALITESVVLTVAHIFDRDPKSIIIGEWNDAVFVKPFESAQVYVKKLTKHIEFNPVNLQNDIALIQLEHPVDLRLDNPQIGTVCLPWYPIEDHRCVLATFGDDEFPILKKLELPILKSSNCENDLRKTILGESFILNRESFICAGGEKGKDACKGHGGAPLACKIRGRYQVVGLVSWGLTNEKCSDKGNTPGVYTNVYSYLNWISSVTG